MIRTMMLDAICLVPLEPDVNALNNKLTLDHQREKTKKVIFSIFEFKQLPASKITLYRHALFCPVCLQPAYFRRASKDGKQACFGSRHHLPDCSELNSHLRKEPMVTPADDSENKRRIESSTKNGRGSVENENLTAGFENAEKIEPQDIHFIEQSTQKEHKVVIDFSAKTTKRNTSNDDATTVIPPEHNRKRTEQSKDLSKKDDSNSIKQSLPTLLTSLLRGSSLATSDVWVHTSEKHKWRAKNLFVKLAEAEVLDNVAPRMYWGTISYADKKMCWLNVEGANNIAIPTILFLQALVDKYALKKSHQLKGAKIILFAKCLANKEKTRKFLQLWSNDIQYLHLAFATE